MRTFTLFIIVFAAALGALYAKDESVDSLKSRLDQVPSQDRAKLCVQIAEAQLHNADHLYTAGNVEQARLAVSDIVTYSEKARDAAKDTRKHLKRVEIAVRKMTDKLSDIKRTLAFEDQPPIEQAIQRLQDIRTNLLNEMFKKDKK